VTDFSIKPTLTGERAALRPFTAADALGGDHVNPCPGMAWSD